MGNKNLFLPEFLEDWAQVGQSMATAMERAHKAIKSLTVTTNRVKRVLAGFDQINRLGAKKSAATKKSSSKKQQAPVREDVAQQTQTVLTLKQVLDSLDVAVLDSVVSKVPGLSTAITVVRHVGQQMYATWQEQLLPVGQWLDQQLIPAVGQQLGESFRTAWDIISAFGLQFYQCWQDMGAVSNQTAVAIGQSFLGMGGYFDSLVMKIFGGSLELGNSTQQMAQQIGNAAGQVMTELHTLQGGWAAALGNMQTGVSSLVSGTVSALQSITGYLQGSFSQAWQDGFDALKTPAKGTFNGVIGFMNKVLGGMSGTVNGMVDTVNKLRIKIPDWVPVLGGKQYGFSLKTVDAPQIPYLARGAVLPANQPFLAVVGDQKHGTNVEAPLATIQDAVARVMADHTAGNMAGHEATVAVLQQILEAVLGIDVGESVIAHATQSYRMKEAVMKGGGF